MDGDTSPKLECPLWPGGAHVMQFDAANSGPDRSAYMCACGVAVVEHEDCGTGA